MCVWGGGGGGGDQDAATMSILCESLVKVCRPTNAEYDGYCLLFKLTVSAPSTHNLSPSWDHLNFAGLESYGNYEPV